VSAVAHMNGSTDAPSGAGLRQPRQERSKVSLDRVLAAGAEVLVEGGYPAFTINEIARRAGASTGLIYARFEHKAALFEAVMLREMTRMVDEENAALDTLARKDLPTRDLIEGIVRILADVARREAPLTQTFMERTTVEPTLVVHVKRIRTAPQRIAAMLVDRSDDISRDDPERAADMAFWIATSSLERRVHTDMWRHWRPDPEANWELFVTDLVEVLQAFLLPSPR
jgi:AcrR family transcriptional regulator